MLRASLVSLAPSGCRPSQPPTPGLGSWLQCRGGWAQSKEEQAERGPTPRLFCPFPGEATWVREWPLPAPCLLTAPTVAGMGLNLPVPGAEKPPDSLPFQQQSALPFAGSRPPPP